VTVVVGASILALVAPFTRWLTVLDSRVHLAVMRVDGIHYRGFGSYAGASTIGIGWLTAILAALALVTGLDLVRPRLARRFSGVVPAVCGVLITAVSLHAIVHIDNAGRGGFPVPVTYHVGWGLWATLGCGIAVAAAGVAQVVTIQRAGTAPSHAGRTPNGDPDSRHRSRTEGTDE
jgi:hypothetical protein